MPAVHTQPSIKDSGISHANQANRDIYYQFSCQSIDEHIIQRSLHAVGPTWKQRSAAASAELRVGSRFSTELTCEAVQSLAPSEDSKSESQQSAAAKLNCHFSGLVCQV